MTKNQLHKQLQLIHKDLTKAGTRMQKLATKLGVNSHEGVEGAIRDVGELLKMFEEKEDEI